MKSWPGYYLGIALLKDGPVTPIDRVASSAVSEPTHMPSAWKSNAAGTSALADVGGADDASAIETETDAALRERLRRLLADNHALQLSVDLCKRTIAAKNGLIDDLRRKVNDDPREPYTTKDLLGERDYLRGKITDLETDLAWHKRELARGKR